MSRSRNYCFTLNNYTTEEVKHLQSIVPKCNYLILGFEVGESGTPHIQGYVEFENAKTLTATKKLISSRVHLESRRGTAKQASEYCKKDSEFQEYGTLSTQGCRTDIVDAIDDLKDGKPITEFILENPTLYARYRNTFLDVVDILQRKQQRTTMTRGIWFYGPTGTGKSHKAFELAGDDFYLKVDDGKWWDGYTGQKTVILNDFRGEVTYAQLLNLIDKWPYKVPRRNREPVPFTSELIIITSSLHPSQVYVNLHAKDHLAQLLRRLEVVLLETRDN